MNASEALSDSVPPHVPADLIRDLDVYDLPGVNQDVFDAWKRISDDLPDIFYTPRYGGYWVINSAELLSEVWPDHQRFTSTESLGVPHIKEWVALPAEADPPDHANFRRPINLAFSPKGVQALKGSARDLAIALIESFLPRGECDFMVDFSYHLPVQIFMQTMGLPLSDREWLLDRAQVLPRERDLEKRRQALQDIYGYLGGWIAKRRAAPGDDLLSRIIQIEVGGRPITETEILSESSLVLFGGMDTAAGSMGFIARFLATHEEHRRTLVAEPELIPTAVEELLRRHSVPILGRRVREDMTFHGISMKAGDFVMLVTCLHGLDSRRWEDPLNVDFSRDTRSIMAFGSGIHKCPGANLARTEIKIFLEEWLARIPEFRIKPESQSLTSSGNTMTVTNLILSWA
ncbi:MAG TPA: cytochrome P450 [Rhizomicrobium sp.]|nr:cytochrome P450 [Rhizomicrobium sp.]